jgi:branched-chain amino acid transport system substrate-binding protein
MTPGSEAKIKKEPEKYKYVFRVSLNVIYWAKLLGGTMATLKKEFGFNKVYIMNQDVLWARGTANAMKKRFFLKTGWEVVGHDQYPTGFSDFSSALMKAKAKGAGVLFTCFDMPESGVLVKQWKSIKVPGLIAGFISPMAGEVAWDTFDGKIGGLMNAVFEIGNMPSAKYAPRAGSVDPDAIVAEIEKTDRQGVMGRIKFDAGHQVIYGTDPAQTAVAAFFQWTDDGKRKIVYPPSLAEGKIVLPPWVKK